ncbi:hypothetical protein [uncultured Methylibium sp.]|nr:hypothetical protein [uncultured Methylibium sp.]
MNGRLRIPTTRLPALGGSLLWGAIEFVALCRSRWAGRLTSRAGGA